MTAYRQQIGAILRRHDGRVLMCRRSDGGDYAWQFPAGDVLDGESHEEAMWREVADTLGLERPREQCRLVGHGPAVHQPYCQPTEEYLGREQTLFMLECSGLTDDISPNEGPDAPFDQLRWVSLEESLELIVPAKRILLGRTYEELVDPVPS